MAKGIIKMDAYELSYKLKDLWCELSPKNSGELTKDYKKVPVCIWTEEGYREVVGIKINKLNIIELELDDE